jgi:hypothetical protein
MDIYGQMVFNKGTKVTQWEKDSLFHKCCRENWESICKRMELPHTIQKFLIDQGPKCTFKTVKLLEESIGQRLLS